MAVRFNADNPNTYQYFKAEKIGLDAAVTIFERIREVAGNIEGKTKETAYRIVNAQNDILSAQKEQLELYREDINQEDNRVGLRPSVPNPTSAIQRNEIDAILEQLGDKNNGLIRDGTDLERDLQEKPGCWQKVKNIVWNDRGILNRTLIASGAAMASTYAHARWIVPAGTLALNFAKEYGCKALTLGLGQCTTTTTGS